MSYMKGKYQPKKPPPNPIVVGCFGTIFLAFLYALAYGVMLLATDRWEEVTPAYVQAILGIPETVGATVLGQYLEVPIPLEVILFVEMTVIVALLLGLSSVLYSLYHSATREKEGWELYAEEAERQARMARARHEK